MYNYRFNIYCEGCEWNDGGGIDEVILLHEKKFNQKQLGDMYENALKMNADNGKTKKYQKATYPNDIKKQLIEMYGFMEIKIDCEVDKKLTGDEYMN